MLEVVPAARLCQELPLHGLARQPRAVEQQVGMRRFKKKKKLFTGLLLWPMAQTGCCPGVKCCEGTEHNSTTVWDLKKPFPFTAAYLATHVSLMGCPSAWHEAFQCSSRNRHGGSTQE